MNMTDEELIGAIDAKQKELTEKYGSSMPDIPREVAMTTFNELCNLLHQCRQRIAGDGSRVAVSRESAETASKELSERVTDFDDHNTEQDAPELYRRIKTAADEFTTALQEHVE